MTKLGSELSSGTLTEIKPFSLIKLYKLNGIAGFCFGLESCPLGEVMWISPGNIVNQGKLF